MVVPVQILEMVSTSVSAHRLTLVRILQYFSTLLIRYFCTGPNCNIPLCASDSCFNGGTCLAQNNTLRCLCPCGFTGKNVVCLHSFKKRPSIYRGSRCETPFDICSLTTCQNNGTRIVNTTGCQCSCLCPSTFTGSLCQTPITPVNRTFPGQIIIPIDRPGGKTLDWLQCFNLHYLSFRFIVGSHCTVYRPSLEQCEHSTRYVYNSSMNNFQVFLLAASVCSSPFTLVTPTSFYPFCYQLNQQASLISQLNALQDCGDKAAQLVWFQSVDELQQQLVPALFARGLARGSFAFSHRPLRHIRFALRF